MWFARGRRKPPKPSPECSIDAHEAAEIKASIAALWRFAEDAADECESLRGSLNAAWNEIEELKNRDAIRKAAESVEKELGVD